MVKESASLQVALAHAGRGLFVLPLCWPVDGACGCERERKHIEKDIGKAPLLGKGYQTLRPTEADLRRWWGRWPRANIGLLLEPAGLLVMDLDGEAAVREADAMHLPATHTVRRGDRLHLFFQRPEGCPVTRKTHRGACRAIDVLSAGYVVTAGSLHKSGDRYEVANDAPSVDAPACVVAMLEDKAPLAPPALVPPGVLPETPLPIGPRMRELLEQGPMEGDRYPSRSEAVYALICEMLDAGYSDQLLVGVLAGRPWIQPMRANIERWLSLEIQRAKAKGSAPNPALFVEPATKELTIEQVSALPPDAAQLLLADDPALRCGGAARAMTSGMEAACVLRVLLAKNGGDIGEARNALRWAVRQAAASIATR